MSCLYVSRTFEEADNWGKYFAKIGRPTYSIVKLEIGGNCFYGDATKCFDAQLDEQENMRWRKAKELGEREGILDSP